ncbi:MAG TPA: hypothetical protein PLX23_08765 [Candidatus Hydrogenedens sp.]|nr:hypothetical protein [Candidatus Hydrogenedens sp.]
MNRLENIEQLCLSILADSPDPWVPLDKLVQRCREIMGDESINEAIIMSFLSKHPEVKVFDSFISNNPVLEEILGGQKQELQPVIILKKRLPKERDILIWIHNHLEKLISLLANTEGMETNDTKKEQINNILNKTKVLKEKVKKMIGKEKDIM